MGYEINGEGKKIRNTASCRVFRPDYRKHGMISYAEAADLIGCGVGWVYNLTCGENPKIPKARKRGAFRIRLGDVESYLSSDR